MRLDRAITIALVAMLVAAPSVAGTVYEARSQFQSGSQTAPEVFTIRGWVEGDSARVEMSGHYDMVDGDYLVATGGGETVYLVDPKEERYLTYIAAGGLDGLKEATGGMMDFEFREISTEVLGSTAGGSILGYPTRRVDWRAIYEVEMKTGFGMDSKMRFEVEGQSWLASDLDAEDFSMWLWNGDLKRVLAGIHGDERGFPLRMKSRSKTIGPDGSEEITNSELEVTAIRSEPIAAATFEIPSHYQETTMPTMGGMGAMGGEGGTEAEPQGQAPQGPIKALKGLFGKKKGKKSDG